MVKPADWWQFTYFFSENKHWGFLFSGFFNMLFIIMEVQQDGG